MSILLDIKLLPTLYSRTPLTHAHNLISNCQKSSAFLEHFNLSINISHARHSFPPPTKTKNWTYTLKAKENNFTTNLESLRRSNESSYQLKKKPPTNPSRKANKQSDVNKFYYHRKRIEEKTSGTLLPRRKAVIHLNPATKTHKKITTHFFCIAFWANHCWAEYIQEGTEMGLPFFFFLKPLSKWNFSSTRFKQAEQQMAFTH